MNVRHTVAALATLLFAASSILDAQQPGPNVRTTLGLPADSLYATIRARFASRGYRVDSVDARRHLLIVRTPDDGTRVEVRITPQGDSATVSIQPLDAASQTVQMRAMITVADDLRVAELSTRQPSPPGELPRSRWRPELFVTPGGRLWIARGGLYSSDSARGEWQLALGGERDSVDADALRLGISMAFVSEDTALVGLTDPILDRTRPLVYRTTDRRSWLPVPTADVVGIDAMAAVGRSVWVFGTRFEDRGRRGVYFRSHDAGATWERPALPPQLNDVRHVYRDSPSSSYLATSGRNNVPAFWRTLDGGNTWSPVPTPHDQHVHSVPRGGVRIQEVATVGRWLFVREFGDVFVTHADSMQWRRVDWLQHIAADRQREQLFVLTDSMQAAMLDANLEVVWRTTDRVLDDRDVEQVLAWSGTGYVSTSHSLIYEAQSGVLRLVRPRGSPR